jgi:hypothetical protein
MNSVYIKFLRNLLIFSVILGAIAFCLSLFLPKTYISPALPFLFFFFIATSLISYYFLQQSFSQRFIRFVNTFLLSIIAKLMLYIGVMIAYVFINRNDAVPFMLWFFILYLCYTIFEVVCIIKKTNPATRDTMTS